MFKQEKLNSSSININFIDLHKHDIFNNYRDISPRTLKLVFTPSTPTIAEYFFESYIYAKFHRNPLFRVCFLASERTTISFFFLYGRQSHRKSVKAPLKIFVEQLSIRLSHPFSCFHPLCSCIFSFSLRRC